MSESITTSVRLSPELRSQLERKAKALGRGKNWVVCRALERYLGGEDDRFAEEARIQSMRASRQDADDWTAAADFDQWQP